MKKNTGSEEMGLQTKVLHEWDQFNETHAVTAPIWQTSTFSADSPEHLAALGEAKHPSEFYTRYGNPTHMQAEATIAALENGEAALVASSGMGAIFAAVMTLLERGDHVVAQHNHYAATTKLFRDLLPRWGIERTFVDQTKTEEFAEAILPNTKLIYIESPVNPLLHLTDLRAVADLAKSHGITTIIDNTFATPVNQQPLKLGIDVVVHSATKYLGGHHDLSAGAIVASSSFIERAGVKAEIPTDIQVALWEKFLFVAGHGGVGALTRAPIGVIRALPETRTLIEGCMQEILAVARARQVALADRSIEKAMAFIDSLVPGGTTSLQRDIAAGKPSELDAWNGAVVRLGQESGVPTPLHEFIYHSLLPQELRARGQAQFPA